MSCMTFIEGDSIIHRLDPRGKIVIAAVSSVFIALSRDFTVLAAAVLLAGVLAMVARLPAIAVIKRLLGLNAFMLLLWVTLPFSTGGTSFWSAGPFEATEEGVLLALAITLKGNSIVLLYTVFLGTNEMVHLGHALRHLRVPQKLAHLFLFTVRYIDVIHHEYEHLRNAMKARCFRPRMNLHTYRAFGYLAAMLLARSLDRSERITAAMKCRGFSGKFHVLDHFSVERIDLFFGLGAFVVMLCLAMMEWL